MSVNVICFIHILFSQYVLSSWLGNSFPNSFCLTALCIYIVLRFIYLETRFNPLKSIAQFVCFNLHTINLSLTVYWYWRLRTCSHFSQEKYPLLFYGEWFLSLIRCIVNHSSYHREVFYQVYTLNGNDLVNSNFFTFFTI